MHREAMDHGMFFNSIGFNGHLQRPARLLSEQGMRTAKLQTVIDAALLGSGP
jgi:hypothetical protein